MTKINTTSDLLKRMDNMPVAKAITTAVADGLAAAKQGDFAQARLCVAVYDAFTVATNDSGTTFLVDSADAIQYMKGPGKGADEKQRQDAKKFAENFIDMYASLFSADYSNALKYLKSIEGEKLPDSGKEEKRNAEKTVKRVRVMFGRAMGVAAFLFAQTEKPTTVKLVEKTGEIRQIWMTGPDLKDLKDALQCSFDALERAMREEYPKSRAAQTPEGEEDEATADAGTTLLGSLSFVQKHVTKQNFAAQSKEVRDAITALITELLPLFQNMEEPKQELKKRATLGVKS